MDWYVRPIGAACSPTELRDPRSEPDTEFRYIDISGIDRVQKTITDYQTIRGLEAPSRARKVVQKDDILVATVRPNLNAVAMVPGELHGEIASTGFCVLRANRAVVDPRYLFYRTVSNGFVAALAAKVRGANYPAVSDGDVKAVEIPLPPLSEQRRIVEILDQADRLRRLRTEADAKADRILPALFIKMFGDPATNPMGWPMVPLRQLGVPLSGGAFPLAEQGLANGEVPFIKVSDMNTEGNEWFIRRANHYVSSVTLKRLRVKPAPAGTIVFPKIGAAVATNKKRLLVRETAFDNNVIGVIPKDARFSSYLFGFFQLFDLRTLARSTALPSIKTSELARLAIPRPEPEGAEAFAAQFLAFSEVRDRGAVASHQIDDLFKTVLHRTFSGALTASWREAHMIELLQEMEQQAKAMAGA